MSIANNKTTDGVRPDLAALEVNPPFGFIGSRVLPVSKVSGKAGTYYYATVTADAAAQTGRSPGAAPTAVTLSESSDTFSAAERIKRYKVPYEMVPLVGGVAGSDKLGAKASKRSVMRSLEAAQLAVLVDGAGTDISSAIIDGLIQAATNVRLYSGRTALVVSDGIYRWLTQQTEIKNLLVRTFTGLDASVVLPIQPPAMKAMLQGVCAIDELLIGDFNCWPYGYTLTGAVVKIPDGTDDMSFVTDPEYGRTMVYWPEGASSEFEINSFADDDVRGNVYDAAVWDNVKQFNSGAKSLVKLGSQITTTTTTTT